MVQILGENIAVISIVVNSVLVALISGILVKFRKVLSTFLDLPKQMQEVTKTCEELHTKQDAQEESSKTVMLILSALFDKVFYDKTNGKKVLAEKKLNEMIYDLKE